MSKIPEVFAIFEQKLAHVLSFTVVPLKSKDLKNALEEILTYFSSIVERASKAESRIAELEAYVAELEEEVTKGNELQDSYCDRIAELEAAQRWTKGGDGSHCEDVHWDFKIAQNDAVSAGKVSVDVKTSTDNNKRSKWKAYVPAWGAPAVNKRYLVKLINDWITIATYYLRVGGGYWKDDSGQELADGVVSLWKGLEE